MQNTILVIEINKNANNPRKTRNKMSCEMKSEMVMHFSEVLEVSIRSGSDSLFGS
jgi:hypothetical protein